MDKAMRSHVMGPMIRSWPLTQQGLTGGRKLAIALSSGDIHLYLARTNFGIQELHPFNETAREVFPGTPEVRDGMLWCNERPGPGVDIDEELAAKFHFLEHALNGAFPPVRRIDGSVNRW